MKKFNVLLGVAGTLCVSGLAMLASPSQKDSKEGLVETGFVISMRGNNLSMSNVPLGGNQAAGNAGPGGQRRVVMRTADGQTRELKGKEAEQAAAQFRGKGDGTSVQVNEGNGQKRYTVKGPDGKTRELTPEEFAKLRKQMEQSGAGGHVMVRSSEGGPAPSGTEQKGPRKKVQLHRFVLDDQTRKPDNIERGTKVRVHYRLDGDKKIATRIEVLAD